MYIFMYVCNELICIVPSTALSESVDNLTEKVQIRSDKYVYGHKHH